MTGLPTKAGTIIFALVLTLAFPVLAQQQGDEVVTQEEFDQLRTRVNNLEGKVEELTQEISSEGGKESKLTEELRSVRNELAEVRTSIDEIKNNLKNIRENTFDNEKSLSALQEDYEASARRNLLVAASGIVIGLVAITLYWT
ncbi:MAG: hypothetical protein ABEI54_02470 [Candidatus Bipolaricaulia bacterium]